MTSIKLISKLIDIFKIHLEFVVDSVRSLLSFNSLILRIREESECTVGGLKSDRNGLTKMRVTNALIIVRLL